MECGVPSAAALRFFLKYKPLSGCDAMEHMLFARIGLLFRLATSWNNLSAPVGEIFAKQFSRVARLAEVAIAVMLWCMSPVLWAVVIRFIAKHW